LTALLRAPRPIRSMLSHVDLLRDLGPLAGRRYWRFRNGAVNEALGALDDQLYRRIWEDAAAALEAHVRHIGGRFWEISRGPRTTRVWRQEVMLDHPITARLALDKTLVRRLLQAAEVPVPDAVECPVHHTRVAEDFVKASGVPCVVKPAGGSSGDGVTCSVATVSDLRRAALRAAAFNDNLLVERQAVGEEYRLLLLDGRLLGIVRRGRPQVVGDGVSSIAELIETENRRRLDGPADGSTHLLRTDLDCVFALRAQNRTLRTVPTRAERVVVKTAVNQNCAREQDTITTVAPALVEGAARAAAAVGVRLAGVDVIITDPGASLAAAGGVVLEVNANPGLHHHYLVADPAGAVPVAVPILATLLAEQHGIARDSSHGQVAESVR
jgi:D-alanine-D-alanine ligase-like ATP-grasp enzyme